MNPEAITWALALAVTILQLRDLRTTKDGFKHGAYEKNPISKALGTKAAKIVASVIALGLAAVYHVSPSPLIPLVLGLAIGFYGLVVYQNIKVKQRIKESSPNDRIS